MAMMRCAACEAPSLGFASEFASLDHHHFEALKALLSGTVHPGSHAQQCTPQSAYLGTASLAHVSESQQHQHTLADVIIQPDAPRQAMVSVTQTRLESLVRIFFSSASSSTKSPGAILGVLAAALSACRHGSCQVLR